MARTAEAIGLDSIWVGDHLLYRDRGPEPVGPWEAWSQLAALAAITERVEIGPLVASTSFHNPAMLAAKAQRRRRDQRRPAHPRPRRRAGTRPSTAPSASRSTSASAASRRRSRSSAACSPEGYVDFGGRFYEVRELPLLPPPARPGGPPLMVGSIGPRMLSITLPHVAAWNAWGPWFGNDVGGYGPVRDQVDAACRAVGRDPAEVERTVALVVAMPGALGRGSAVTDEPFAPIAGDPDTLAQDARARSRTSASRHVQLVLDPITVDSIAALAPTLAALDG